MNINVQLHHVMDTIQSGFNHLDEKDRLALKIVAVSGMVCAAAIKFAYLHQYTTEFLKKFVKNV